MQLGRVFDIGMAIVMVAAAWVLVKSTQTAAIIKAFGAAFSGGLKAATGQK